MQTKGIEIKLEWHEEGFKTSKKVMLYKEHITEDLLAETLKKVKAIVTKAAKKDSIWVEVDYMDIEYHCVPQTRVILQQFLFDELWELDYRKYNGTDFSNKRTLNFPSQASMVKYVIQDVEKLVRYKFTDIPEERSEYLQLLDQKDIEENSEKVL